MREHVKIKIVATATLAEARAWLQERVEDGVKCPCCGQMAKVYRRKINSGMASTLITMYRYAQCSFIHVPSLPGDTHEVSQLAWWGLIEEERIVRDDGGRAGVWRLTHDGELFVRGLITVPKYAHVYDSEVIKLDGENVTIRDALGSRFNYTELMQS